MKPQEYGIRTLSMLRHLGLRDWRVRLIPVFKDCPDIAGYCHWAHRAIELNTGVLCDADDAHIRRVVFHEVAHALLGEQEAHSPKFWQTVRTLEACPDAAQAWNTLPAFKVCARTLESKKSNETQVNNVS